MPVTRYFMTIGEAVHLVIQAGAIGGDGNVLALDMGEPVSIVSVAEQLTDLGGKPVDIIFTGLRQGEKPHEQPFSIGEGDERPHHPLISHVHAPPFAPLRTLGRRTADAVWHQDRGDAPPGGGEHGHGRGAGSKSVPGVNTSSRLTSRTCADYESVECDEGNGLSRTAASARLSGMCTHRGALMVE